jgi:hypothetical protein
VFQITVRLLAGLWLVLACHPGHAPSAHAFEPGSASEHTFGHAAHPDEPGSIHGDPVEHGDCDDIGDLSVSRRAPAAGPDLAVMVDVLPPPGLERASGRMRPLRAARAPTVVPQAHTPLRI